MISKIDLNFNVNKLIFEIRAFCKQRIIHMGAYQSDTWDNKEEYNVVITKLANPSNAQINKQQEELCNSQ